MDHRPSPPLPPDAAAGTLPDTLSKYLSDIVEWMVGSHSVFKTAQAQAAAELAEHVEAAVSRLSALHEEAIQDITDTIHQSLESAESDLTSERDALVAAIEQAGDTVLARIRHEAQDPPPPLRDDTTSIEAATQAIHEAEEAALSEIRAARDENFDQAHDAASLQEGALQTHAEDLVQYLQEQTNVQFQALTELAEGHLQNITRTASEWSSELVNRCQGAIQQLSGKTESCAEHLRLLTEEGRSHLQSVVEHGTSQLSHLASAHGETLVAYHSDPEDNDS